MSATAAPCPANTATDVPARHSCPSCTPPKCSPRSSTYRKLWDKAGILNPGSITDADAIEDNLALEGIPDREWRTHFELRPVEAAAAGADAWVHAVQACIGVGRCRSDSGGVMCPSYRATGDEKDSTRGRSRVLQDMVRGARTIDEGWKSEDVREALDLCLACKACSNDCPAGVDMATLQVGVLLPLLRGQTPAHVALLPRLAAALAETDHPDQPAGQPGSGEPARESRGGRRRFDHAAEDAQVRFPEDAPRRVRCPLQQPGHPGPMQSCSLIPSPRVSDPKWPEQRPGSWKAPAGTVGCESDACCGLTWISTGQLDTAKKLMGKAVAKLDDGTDAPIVVIEPSCAAALKKDAPELLGTEAAERVSHRIRSFAEAVKEWVDGGWTPPAVPTDVTVQTHCHEYSTFGATVQRKALAALGVANVNEATGCCGVAGNFGFEANHYDISMKVAEQALAPALAQTAADVPVLADGFSCAMQVKQLEPERKSLHLAELLDPQNTPQRAVLEALAREVPQGARGARPRK